MEGDQPAERTYHYLTLAIPAPVSYKFLNVSKSRIGLKLEKTAPISCPTSSSVERTFTLVDGLKYYKIPKKIQR